MGDWKAVFAEQRAHRFDVWREPFVVLRSPKVFNLRRDPFERADTDSNNYNTWWSRNTLPYLYKSQAVVGQFVATFEEFPVRQRPASFTVNHLLEHLYKKAPKE